MQKQRWKKHTLHSFNYLDKINDLKLYYEIQNFKLIRLFGRESI